MKNKITTINTHKNGWGENEGIKQQNTNKSNEQKTKQKKEKQNKETNKQQTKTAEGGAHAALALRWRARSFRKTTKKWGK